MYQSIWIISKSTISSGPYSMKYSVWAIQYAAYCMLDRIVTGKRYADGQKLIQMRPNRTRKEKENRKLNSVITLFFLKQLLEMI